MHVQVVDDGQNYYYYYCYYYRSSSSSSSTIQFDNDAQYLTSAQAGLLLYHRVSKTKKINERNKKKNKNTNR